MSWQAISFETLRQGEVVEFYDIDIDPNLDSEALAWQGGPVEVKTAPGNPGPYDGSRLGRMVLAGSQGYRVRSDEYQPWRMAGGYEGVRLR